MNLVGQRWIGQRWTRGRAVLAALGLVIAALALLMSPVAAPQAAAAGSAQVEVCLAPGHEDIQYYTIDGTNQNGDYVWSPWDNFDKQVGKYRCGIVPDWWWQGWISISFYDSQGTFLGNQWRSAFWVFGGTLGMYFE